MTTDAPRTARQIARQELTRAITNSARRQLIEVGAAALSVRAVARELGMASSAVYRYVASRDDLLTLLIIEAYDMIGAAAEEADRAAVERNAGAGERWSTVGRAMRAWALANQQQWALVYGSPVVGYAAPTDTIAPATRASRVLGGITSDAVATGEILSSDPPRPGPSLPVQPDVVSMISGGHPEAPPDLPVRALAAWAQLVGAINFELFGHLENVVTDLDEWFEAVLRIGATTVGLSIDE